MKQFASIPFLRILLPFVAGVSAGIWLHPTWDGWVALPFFLLLAFFFHSASRQPVSRFAFAADLFLFTLGVTLVQLTDVSKRPDFIGKVVEPGAEVKLVAWPSELPVTKGKWLRCEMTIHSAGTAKKQERAEGKILAYFPAGTDRELLMPGRMLVLTTALVPAQRPMNPGEFDYAGWLANRGIHFTCFLDENAAQVASVPEQINPVWKYGLMFRDVVLKRLRESGIGPQTYAICAALLTGQDDDIDRDTIAAFAHSGTLHVLSVSGLHVGLVYLALAFVFGIFERKKKRKLARLLFLFTGLWAFALFTGFAAPVLRAVIMFSLVSVGSVYFRNTARNQLNILFVSAFILLSWNPFFLTDVGFLLSYTAMIGLICLTPWFSRFWNPRTYAGDVVWKSLCASVAATLSTLPLTLFFFKQFPLWFFVCNLVVVPASTLMLLLAFLLACGADFVAIAADFVVASLVKFIRWFNTPGAGYIDYIDFDRVDLFFSTMVLLLFSWLITGRSYRTGVAAMLVLIGWQIYSIGDSWAKKNLEVLTVYHISRQSAVSIKQINELTLFMSDTSRYDFSVRPSVVGFNRPHSRRLPFNLVTKPGLTVFLLDDVLRDIPAEAVNAQVVVLTKKAQLPADPLSVWPSLKLVVCDGSVPAKIRNAAADICRNFNTGFHSTAESGAWQLPLDNETAYRR